MPILFRIRSDPFQRINRYCRQAPPVAKIVFR
jgi:hypothetical protein